MQNSVVDQSSEKRVITANPFVRAAMLPFKDVAEYPSIKGMENVVISNGKIVNVVSDNYGFISNQDFFGGFEEKLKAEHIKFTPVYKNVNDVQFVADYFLEGELFVGDKKRYPDVIKPKIRLQNSYDGKITLAGYFGFFRQVCSNGLHVMKDELAFKLRRTAKNIEIVFPSMSEMLESYKKNEMVKLHRSFEVLSETPVTDVQELVKHLVNSNGIFKFEASDKNPEPGSNGRIVLNTVANESQILKTVPNAWIVYNAVNEWIYNDAINKKDEGARKDLDVKLFASIVKAVN